MNVHGMKSQLEELKSDQDALAKKTNKKVMGMIEREEVEYVELLRKRKAIKNDEKKSKLLLQN